MRLTRYERSNLMTEESKPQIKNISEAIVWAKQIQDECFKPSGNSSNQQTPIHIWYRGHKDKNYELIPNAFRIKDGNIYEENGMLAHLMRRLPQYQDNGASTLDFLSLSRYYELPCRLLDWTENVLIALWFAVDNTDSTEEKKDAKIFALNARELSDHTEFKHYQTKEKFVYGPKQFNVVLRSELALTSYLDELLLRPSVKNAAFEIGFSEQFWVCLLKLIAHLTEDDIKKIEKENDTNNTNITIDRNNQFLSFENKAIENLCSRLYALMPIWLQQDLGQENDSKSYSEIAKNWLYNFLFALRKPVAVFPDRRNMRISAQSGMFVLAGGDYLPEKLKKFHIKSTNCRIPKPMHLEAWNNSKILNFAIIPHEQKKTIRDELDMIGFNYATLFPDFDRQAKYIKNFWSVPLAGIYE